MGTRCTNPKTRNFHLYGGKGVRVEWTSFEDFRDDMYDSYIAHAQKHGEKNTSIDRIDTNGNYKKENCRWATPKEQGRNTSQNKRLTFQGKTLTLGEWAEETGLHPGIISQRISKGWSIEKTLTKKGLRQHEYDGKKQSLADWSRELGISYGVLWDRVIKRGWTLERAFKK